MARRLARELGVTVDDLGLDLAGVPDTAAPDASHHPGR
jgi:hypothetical protein